MPIILLAKINPSCYNLSTFLVMNLFMKYTNECLDKKSLVKGNRKVLKTEKGQIISTSSL